MTFTLKHGVGSIRSACSLIGVDLSVKYFQSWTHDSGRYKRDTNSVHMTFHILLCHYALTKSEVCVYSFLHRPLRLYRYCSISVELRSWSGDGALFTQLDKYRVFFHTSNC